MGELKWRLWGGKTGSIKERDGGRKAGEEREEGKEEGREGES